MRHGSLFSGIGGFDLAAEWMGWENVFHCEWEDFPRKVLKYYWPNAISYGDITKTDFTIHRGDIDILTGGFPCQPYSMAGKRKGKDDARHLWPHMLRAIREIKPTYIVGENVSGLLNWNDGMVFDEIHADLEAEGYEVQSFVLPAVSVGAPHRRDRVWIVAHANHPGTRKSMRNNGIREEKDQRWQEQPQSEFGDDGGDAADADCNGQHGCNCEYEVNASQGGVNAQRDIEQICEYAADTQSLRKHREAKHEDDCGQGRERRGCDPDNTCEVQGGNDATNPTRSSSEGKLQQRPGQGQPGGCDCENAADTCRQGLQGREKSGNTKDREWEGCSQIKCAGRDKRNDGWFDDFPTQPPVCNRNDGLSDRLVGVTFPKWRNESIKAMGNAIVPQVALQIFKAIDQI